MNWPAPRVLGFLALVGAVALSGLGVVYTKFESRRLFSEYQDLLGQRDALEIDYGRLQLELTTVGTPWWIAQRAEEKLGMGIPDPKDIVLVFQP